MQTEGQQQAAGGFFYLQADKVQYIIMAMFKLMLTK